MPWLGGELGEGDHAGQRACGLFLAPGRPVGFVEFAAAADQPRLIRRVVQHGLVDIQYHGGLEPLDRRDAVVLAQGVPLPVLQCGQQAGLGIAIGLQVDQVVLDRGLGPDGGVEVVVRRHARSMPRPVPAAARRPGAWVPWWHSRPAGQGRAGSREDAVTCRKSLGEKKPEYERSLRQRLWQRRQDWQRTRPADRLTPPTHGAALHGFPPVLLARTLAGHPLRELPADRRSPCCW